MANIEDVKKILEELQTEVIWRYASKENQIGLPHKYTQQICLCLKIKLPQNPYLDEPNGHVFDEALQQVKEILEKLGLEVEG